MNYLPIIAEQAMSWPEAFSHAVIIICLTIGICYMVKHT